MRFWSLLHSHSHIIKLNNDNACLGKYFNPGTYNDQLNHAYEYLAISITNTELAKATHTLTFDN